MARKAKLVEENEESVESIKREQFDFLNNMAKMKCELFKHELMEMCKGNEVEGYYSSQYFDIRPDCHEEVNVAINSFFKGKEYIREHFHKLVYCAFEAMVLNSSVGENQVDIYFVYPENDTIVRLDVKAYLYSFSKKGVVADCKNVFCYTIAKSIVDRAKITGDDVVYYMTKMCKGTNSNGFYCASDEGEVKVGQVMEFMKELMALATQ